MGKKGLKGRMHVSFVETLSDVDVSLSDNESHATDNMDSTNSMAVSNMVVDDNEEESENDSEKELQVALKEGLLKSDQLNYAVERKRPVINRKEEMKEKLKQLQKDLPWIEVMDVTVCNEEVEVDEIEDDFQREVAFYKQAEKAVRLAVPRLLQLGVKVFRPDDYYAEMVKSDDHMQKVRCRLLDTQQGKERQEAIRRLRQEKKFASKVQREVLENRQTEKKKLLEAAKKHRKGMKAQLEDMISNAKRLNVDEGEEDEPVVRKNPINNRRQIDKKRKHGLSRVARDRKFGFGGQKKRSKRNDERYDGSPFGSSGGFKRRKDAKAGGKNFGSSRGRYFGRGKK